LIPGRRLEEGLSERGFDTITNTNDMTMGLKQLNRAVTAHLLGIVPDWGAQNSVPIQFVM
jgi:hypothetical protein